MFKCPTLSAGFSCTRNLHFTINKWQLLWNQDNSNGIATSMKYLCLQNIIKPCTEKLLVSETLQKAREHVIPLCVCTSLQFADSYKYIYTVWWVMRIMVIIIIIIIIVVVMVYEYVYMYIHTYVHIYIYVSMSMIYVFIHSALLL